MSKINPKSKADEKIVFVSMPYKPADTFDVVYNTIKLAGEIYSLRITRFDKEHDSKTLDELPQAIKSADIIVADLSDNRPNVTHEVGQAQAHNKEIIYISHTAIKEVASNLKTNKIIEYSTSKIGLQQLALKLREEFKSRLGISTIRIAIVNSKGGSGKSTLTMLLAEGLNARGKKVLLVDLDPQESLTYMLSSPEQRIKTVVDISNTKRRIETNEKSTFLKEIFISYYTGKG